MWNILHSTPVLGEAHVIVVNRHGALVVQQLHLGARIAGAQLPGHAVVVPVFAQLDVIVELDRHFAGLLQREVVRRQRRQGVPLDLLEQLAP